MVFMLMDTTKSTSRRQVEDPENRGRLRACALKRYGRKREEGSEGSREDMKSQVRFSKKQGLVSIRTLWIQIHYPAKAS